MARSIPRNGGSLKDFDAEAVRTSATWGVAIRALEHALLTEVDPELDDPRLSSKTPHGEFLLMPSAAKTYSGVKALTIAPRNPARGLDLIQGVYILFDSDTLAPLATLDGRAITAIRTPATSLLAIKHISQAAPRDRPFPDAPRILVFGTGVQALNHVRAASFIFPEANFAVAGRRAERIENMRERLVEDGIHMTPANPSDVSKADVIICNTASAVPLFDGSEPAPDAIIAAVGAHGLGAREVDTALVLRSDIVVEGRASAWLEAGDLIPARSVEEWQHMQPPNLRELVNGQLTRTPGRPCLFNSVGMSWEDLIIAAVVYESGTHEHTGKEQP
jgi:ornithine cyclodeaminase